MAGDIIKGSDHFFINKYVGNGAGQKTGRFVPFTDNATIAKSCMFDDDTNNYLSRTPGSNGSAKKLTLSVWVKRNAMGVRDIMFTNDFSANGEVLQFDSSNRLYYYKVQSGWSYVTNMTFEDTSKWYHIVIARDTDDSTAGDRVKIYVDGTRITSFNSSSNPSSGATGFWNQTTYANVVGSSGNASYIRGIGYLAEMNMIDGTVYEPSTFGMTDTSTGRWIPKSFSSLSYGTNGFRFEFANSAGQTIGDDTSGNGNDFSVTNLDPHNIGNDTPTSNYAKMSVNYHGGATNNVREGGRRMQPASGSDDATFFDMKFKTGKWYCEFYCHSADAVAQYIYNGIADFERYVTDGVQELGRRTHSYCWDPANEYYRASGTFNIGSGTGKLYQGDIGGIAVDFDNNKIYFHRNGTYILSSNPANGTGGLAFAPAHDTVSGFYHIGQSNGTGSSGYNNDVSWNVGDNPTFNGTLAVGAAANTDGFGSTFKYTPPTGFKGLSFDNQPDEGVKPDIAWIKNRDATDSHQFYDSSRGPLNRLKTDSTDGEDVVDDGLQRFIKGGSQIEDDVAINTKGEKFVSWNWVAGGGTTSANTDGVGATVACTIQKNTTAGISIVEWTGGGSAGTIEHGLGKVPAWMMYKRKSADGDGWIVYHHKMAATPEDGSLQLQGTGGFSDDATLWNDTAPTTQLATIGSYGMGNTEKRVGFFFAEIPGFSRFGNYSGNGNGDGPFVYMGFKPSWIMVKQVGSNYWAVFDTERKDFNPNTLRLAPNYNYVENDTAEGAAGNNAMDFLSNGIKMRGTDTTTNQSGGSYVYFAFAEHPFNGDGENAFATAR